MPRTHGDRIYDETLRMPPVPTLAQTFRDAGYQAYAVGKLHVMPPRDRIGFDDVILEEDGRLQFGSLDDYEIFLGDRGYVGQTFAHGMSNNEYWYRSWHLPEECHVTNWASQQMARTIKRRDPTRPALWYLSYRHPHPPLAPLQCYSTVSGPRPGLPGLGMGRTPCAATRYGRCGDSTASALDVAGAACLLRPLYYIGHQLRFVIGTLWEGF
jgi:hypothetical protein